MSHRLDYWDFVNPQDSSPLFNGRIPAEIRTLVFEFALAEFVAPALDRPIRHDFFARDDHEKLDDEPDWEGGPDIQEGDRGVYEDDVQTSDTENSPAPAVRGLSAQTLLRFGEKKGSWDWFRPGHSGPRKIHTALLRTCRRVYLETYGLPSQGTKVFYNARGPRWCPQSPAEYVSGLPPGAAQHIRKLQIFPQMWFLEGELMDMVTGIFSAESRRLGRHLVPVANRHPPPISLPRALRNSYYLGRLSTSPSTSAYPPGSVGRSLWLEVPPRTGPSEAERIRPWCLTEHITSVRIYLRRTDWWEWEGNAPLVISPFNTSPDRPTTRQMQESMRATVEADQKLEPHLRSSSPSQFPHWSCWGLMFLRMTNIQELTIDFETSDDKKSEMETIVGWAQKHWRFPVLRRLHDDDRDPYTFGHLQRCHAERPVDLSPWSQDLDVFSAADEPVQKTSWRGLPHHYSEYCHACTIEWDIQSGTPTCDECKKRQRLLDLTKGPQIFVWTVTWKRKVPARDPEPEPNAGGEASQQQGRPPRP